MAVSVLAFDAALHSLARHMDRLKDEPDLSVIHTIPLSEEVLGVAEMMMDISDDLDAPRVARAATLVMSAIFVMVTTHWHHHLQLERRVAELDGGMGRPQPETKTKEITRKQARRVLSLLFGRRR